MNISTVLENLVGFFAKENVDFALIGAFALHAYGYVRATADIDFVVNGEDQERIVRFLESLGYETLHRSKRFSNHLHPVASLGRIETWYTSKVKPPKRCSPGPNSYRFSKAFQYPWSSPNTWLPLKSLQ